jgi:hypothetical protein
MRLVVLFPGALGDLCLLAPALAAAAASGAHVALSVQRSLEPAATLLLPTAALGPPMDGAAMASLFTEALDPALARWLGAADRIHAWLARADRDGVVSARLAAVAVPFALHAVPRDDDAPHHASRDYALALGMTAPLVPVDAPPPIASIALPWREPPARRLVLHPGAGAPAKVWAADGFRYVADGWRKAGGEVAVLLGPAEASEAHTWTVLGHEPLVGLPIREAAAVIASAPTWIGNDSGMSHLAGALGRRGVVVFRSTRPERWRPVGGRLAVVECGSRPTEVVAHEVLTLLAVTYLDTPILQH